MGIHTNSWVFCFFIACKSNKINNADTMSLSSNFGDGDFCVKETIGTAMVMILGLIDALRNENNSGQGADKYLHVKEQT